MSSSPMPHLAGQLPGAASLAEVLKLVPDPRARRGIRHGLPGIVAVALAAVVGGARSFAAIGQWAGELTSAQLAELGLSRGVAPDASTFRKVLARLDAPVLDQLAGSYMWTRTRAAGGRRVIAIEGKTIRGARTAAKAAPHLVSAFDHASGTVLGQLATAAKSNEIPAVRVLLAGLDLAGVVVTVDAMYTQADTATVITRAGGDYVFTVKANQPDTAARARDGAHLARSGRCRAVLGPRRMTEKQARMKGGLQPGVCGKATQSVENTRRGEGVLIGHLNSTVSHRRFKRPAGPLAIEYRGNQAVPPRSRPGSGHGRPSADSPAGGPGPPGPMRAAAAAVMTPHHCQAG